MECIITPFYWIMLFPDSKKKANGDSFTLMVSVFDHSIPFVLLVFDFTERPNYNNNNKIGTRCRWVRLDDQQWLNGKIMSVPKTNYDFGYIKYEDITDRQDKQIRYSVSSLSVEYRDYIKIGDDVKFHIEHVVTKSTYDVIPPTAVHIDTTLLYRPKSNKKHRKTYKTRTPLSKNLSKTGPRHVHPGTREAQRWG